MDDGESDERGGGEEGTVHGGKSGRRGGGTEAGGETEQKVRAKRTGHGQVPARTRSRVLLPLT